MSEPALDLTISIVISYNSSAYLRKCLTSIYAANLNGLKIEVIVVDNASLDDSVAMLKREFPQVRLIANDENLNFTRAHNQALSVASGKYFLYMNPDIEIEPDAPITLTDLLEIRPDIGAAGGQEHDGLGNISQTGARFKNWRLEAVRASHILNSWWPGIKQHAYMIDWDRTTSRTVDVLTHGFLMVRTDLLRELNGCDERLKLYFSEDILCQRIWRAEFKVYFEAGCHYMHHGQGSVRTIPPEELRAIYERDRITFYRIQYGLPYAYMVKGLLGAGRLLNRIVRRLTSREIAR